MPKIDELVKRSQDRRAEIRNDIDTLANKGAFTWHDGAGRLEPDPVRAIATASERLVGMKSSLDVAWQRRIDVWAERLRSDNYSDRAVSEATRQLRDLGLSDRLKAFLLAADPFVEHPELKKVVQAGTALLDRLDQTRAKISDDLPLGSELLPDLAAAAEAVTDRLTVIDTGQRLTDAASARQEMILDVNHDAKQAKVESLADVASLTERFVDGQGTPVWANASDPLRNWDRTLDDRQGDLSGHYARDPAQLVQDLIIVSRDEFENALSYYGVKGDAELAVATAAIEALLTTTVVELRTSFGDYNSAYRALEMATPKKLKGNKPVLDFRDAAWRVSEVLTRLDDALEDAWFRPSGVAPDFWKHDKAAQDAVLRTFVKAKSSIAAVRDRVASDAKHVTERILAAG